MLQQALGGLFLTPVQLILTTECRSRVSPEWTPPQPQECSLVNQWIPSQSLGCSTRQHRPDLLHKTPGSSLDPFQQVSSTNHLLQDLQPYGEKEEVEEKRKRGHCPAAVHRSLSSYFTRKHSHSFLKSPAGQSPALSAIHSCTCPLHSLASIFTEWMQISLDLPLSLCPPICRFISQKDKKKILIGDRGSWSQREYFSSRHIDIS